MTNPLAPNALSGRRALVTGSSRGIGADTVRYFAEAGADVVINYRNKAARAEKLATELGAHVFGSADELVAADVVDAIIIAA